MARNVGRVARRVWSCCSVPARNAIAESGASSSSSSPSAGAAAHARPSLRHPSPATQQPLFGCRKQSVHYYTRLPGEIGSISSLMPRHNATAAARLVSKLSGDLTPQIEGFSKDFSKRPSCGKIALVRLVHDRAVSRLKGLLYTGNGLSHFAGMLARYVSPI